jgi:glycosyltransferase involved in cell wall biosynthesis
MKLSVIIPAYNEEQTISEVIERVQATQLVHEIIVVDDGSQDDTVERVQTLRADNTACLQLLQHPHNRGKGAAVRTGLAAATGDFVLVQDADLEYNPADYPTLLAPFTDPKVEVVYGSRNLRRNPKSTLAFYWGGRLLSWVTNLLYGSSITDEATGYKVIKTDLLRDIGLEADGFEFCPEVTGKLLRRGVKIREVPISYQPRSREEGKKIQWVDGLIAIWTLLKYRFFADIPSQSKSSSSFLSMTLILLLATVLRLPWLELRSSERSRVAIRAEGGSTDLSWSASVARRSSSLVG